MTDLATWPAVRLAAAVRDRQVSSRELLEIYLDRIDRLGPPVNAVVTVDADGARRADADADRLTAGGEQLGPLHGLPMTVKDAIETAGLRSTGGAVELAGHVPDRDAPAVARLKAAGAIVFGKTNAPRWSFDVQTFNEVFGTTSNPWALDHSPGGSSGGAAAAVACGFTSFELGTDIGGSIRLPAHCCGVFGLKPTFGVVPQRGYLDHAGGGSTDADINVFGPLTRSAEDLDLLLGVLAGPGAPEARAWRLDLPAGGDIAGRPARRALARQPGLQGGRRVPRPAPPGGRRRRRRRRQDRGCRAEGFLRPPVRRVHPSGGGRHLPEPSRPRRRLRVGDPPGLAASRRGAPTAPDGVGGLVRRPRRPSLPGIGRARLPSRPVESARPDRHDQR
jgi:hypothetical protein